MSLTIDSRLSADDFTIDEILALLGRQVAVEHQLRHADDAVHRRPDLVAHVGQELAFRPAAFHRLVAHPNQLRLLVCSSRVRSWTVRSRFSCCCSSW